MPFYFNKGRKFKKRDKYTNVEKVAYHMGQIERALKNPNSRVYESYQNGLKGKKDKKPLI